MSVFKQSTIFIEILCSIEYSEINQDFRCKLNEILSFAFKVDIDLGLKIRILLKKIFNDEMALFGIQHGTEAGMLKCKFLKLLFQKFLPKSDNGNS